MSLAALTGVWGQENVFIAKALPRRGHSLGKDIVRRREWGGNHPQMNGVYKRPLWVGCSVSTLQLSSIRRAVDHFCIVTSFRRRPVSHD